MPDPKTLEERAEAIEQSAARMRRHWPLSRRQQLILAAKRLAAVRLRKEAARIRASTPYPTTPVGLTLGARDHPTVLGTCTSPPPYRVFRVIHNPAANSLTHNRGLARGALRIVTPDPVDFVP